MNILPGLESHYRWEGKKEKTAEVLLVIKTRRSLFGKVEKAIGRAHSYSVPEILALPIVKGSRKYLAWLARETK